MQLSTRCAIRQASNAMPPSSLMSPTIVMITGVTRGIGNTILQSYLQRPGHIVIGSVRNKTSQLAQELQQLPRAAGSQLVIVRIESTSPSDPAEAVRDIVAAGIDHIDIVIANAGGLRETVAPLEAVTADDVTETFQTNALGPLMLFQAVHPLLRQSHASPKWVSVSSSIGSIGYMQSYHSHLAPAYGISKAALNWITMAIHCGNPWLVAFCINPGMVQSEPGNRNARLLGLDKAPITLRQAADAIIGLADKATREETSSKFFQAMTGLEIPW
ncbi:hypothetical protein F5X97DRAFT_317589 [Nemania serpens]|nr:hypothetical protein F5X97DRAFT_317589 [Nemania serpens]